MNRGGIVIIGPGRVGTLLAVALARAGRRVQAVAGGRPESRERVTGLVAGVRPVADPADAVPAVGTIILTTPDDAIESVVTGLAAADALSEGQRVVHVSGAHGTEVLRRAALAGCRVAACHPAQTVPAGTTDPEALVGTQWAITCAEPDRVWTRDLVESIGGDLHQVPDDRRTLYHAALTVGSNAVGAAVAVARQLLLAADVDDPAAFLAPLVEASSANVLRDGAAALTGPLVRGDAGTISQHLEALDADLPTLAAAYRELSRVLLAQVAPELDDDARAAIEDLLA